MGGTWANLIGWIGVGVFALTGALVAARKGMDPFGFALLGTVTGIGGGSVRDVFLGQPVFWIVDPTDVIICVAVSLLTYVAGMRVSGLMAALQPRRLLLWADALGLAIFAVTGTQKAFWFNAHPVTAIVLGTLTASFGGIIRDILAGEPPMVLHREIYVTAAAAGATAFALALLAGLGPSVAGLVGFGVGFGLRALAILRDWSLPPFKARPD
jgi:uncharacterized membrane protein YeiH